MKRDDPILSQVIAYWESLRVAGAIPARADLDPRVIQQALNNAFILDRARPGTVRFRVAGQNLNALMGMEVRGMPIRAFFDLMERRSLMEHIEACFTAPAVLEMDVISEDAAQNTLSGRMLILPMRDHEGQITKALGCLVTSGTIGAPPRRFQMLRQQLTPILSAEKTPPLTARPPSAITGFAAKPALYQPAPVAPTIKPARPDQLKQTEVPYLRIVQ